MTIDFDILSGDIKVPTVAAETDWVSGTVGTPTKEKALLLLGSMLAAGTATADTTYQIFGDGMARDLFGKGSIVAGMVEAAFKISPRIPIYAAGLTEPGGVAGSGVVTLAGTATGSGTLSVWVAGQKFRVGIETGDTHTEVGDLIAAKINAAANLPATAANATGTVTITCRNKGIVGNSIRYRSSITAAGLTSTDTGAAFASGTLASDPTAALAAVAAQRYHIKALGEDDSTAAAALETDVDARSTPGDEHWCMGIVGSCGNSTAVNALAAALDNYRQQVIWGQGIEEPAWAGIAAFAAERARVTQRNKTLNYHELKGLTPRYGDGDWPIRSEEEAALGNGVTPLRPLRNGTVEVVRSIVSRTTTPAFIDHGIIEISDYVDEDLITQLRRRYADAALKVNSPANTENVATPERVKAVLHERMRIWDQDMDYTQGADTDIAAGETVCEQNADDAGRLDVGYPFRPVQGMHVIAIMKRYTLPAL